MKLRICQHCEQPLMATNSVCPRCEMPNDLSHGIWWLLCATSALMGLSRAASR